MPTDDRPRDEFPASTASLARLRHAGWTVAVYTIRYVSPPALEWIVVGEAGAARLLAAGATRDEAGWRACEQAEAIGMLPPTEVDAG